MFPPALGSVLQIFQCGAPWKLVQSRPIDGPKDKELHGSVDFRRRQDPRWFGLILGVCGGFDVQYLDVRVGYRTCCLVGAVISRLDSL